MKILYIHQYFTTPDGQGGSRSYDFARHFVEKGHKVTLITGGTGLRFLKLDKLVNRFNMDGIDIIAINVPYSSYMGYARRGLAFVQFMLVAMLVAIRLEKVDLVYASSTPITVGFIGRAAALWHRARFIFEVRDLWPEYIADFGLTKNRLILGAMRAAARRFYKKAEKVVVISDSMNDRVQALYPEAKGKVVTIPLGSEVDSYKGDAKLDLPAIPEGDFMVAYTGSLGYVNGVSGLLKLAEKLSGKGVSFIIAGEGNEKPALMKMKDELKLGNVHFLGRISKKEAFSLIKMADACMITHIFKDRLGRVYMNCRDSLTNKFFDYIAEGKPVIINHESESEKYIRKFSCGVRVPFDDYDTAAEEILKLKRDPDLRIQMGENGRRLALEVFDRKKMAEKCEALFRGGTVTAGRRETMVPLRRDK